MNNSEINSVQEPAGVPETVDLPEHFVMAFVIDDVVQQVITVDTRFAAILLSSPTVIDVTDVAKAVNITGWKYNADTNQVIPPTDI